MKPIIIGVAGGTGSGKTTIVKEIIRGLGEDRVSLLQHDSYYRDRSHLAPEERAQVNFDHPDSLETDLLVAHLRALTDGRAVKVPVYDFATHARSASVQMVEPKGVIIVEGILVLADQSLRSLQNIKLFVDTDADIRLIRRIERDVAERGRSMRSVIDQYVETIRPMHLEFVEPSKRFADLIIPEGGSNLVAIDMIVAKIRSLID